MSKNETKILGWQIDDVKSLLRYVKENNGVALSKVFASWANKNARQAYSVRNYYYKLIDKLKNDINLCKMLNIDKNMIRNSILTKHFSHEQSVWLLKNILQNKEKLSVRAKCLKLANGDVSKMIRYQNKYRNLIEKQANLVQDVLRDLQAENIETINPFRRIQSRAKIFSMPIKNNLITDSEMEALFRGLVKLVKANAEKEIGIKNKQENSLVNNALSVALANLRKKDIIINDINSENQKLKTNLTETQHQLTLLKTQNLSNITTLQEIEKSQKMEELKMFLDKLANAEKQVLNQPEN